MNGTDDRTRLHTTFFGPASWYRQLARLGLDAIDSTENYVKQTTRNHCLIGTANGQQKLTVPVAITRHPTPITQVRLSDHDNWRTKHWNAIATAYGQSPFFDYYADDLRPFFEQRQWELLFDYNMAIARKMLELLDIRQEDKQWKEMRGKGQELCGKGQEERPYWQVHQQRTGFLAGLSILDLLCNMGPEAVFYL